MSICKSLDDLKKEILNNLHKWRGTTIATRRLLQFIEFKTDCKHEWILDIADLQCDELSHFGRKVVTALVH